MANPLTGMFEMPQQKQSLGQKAMQGVRNFGAGLAGVGPEYVMMQKQEQNQLSRDREMAMVKDALQVKKLLDSREYDNAINLIDNRVKAISKLGGDPSDTLGLRQMIVSGNVEQAAQGLDMFLAEAQSAFPEVFAPKDIDPGSLIDGRYRGSVNPDGTVSMQDVYQMGGVQPPAPEQTDAFRTLNDRAVAAGLQPGTPEYQAFMAQGGVQPPSQRGYRMLTEQEMAERRLDPARSYQVNEETGQITAVGGGPVSVTEINMPTPVDEGTKKYGEGIGERANARIEQAVSAQSQNAVLARMNEAMESGAKTGLGQETILDIKNVANSLFGIPIDPAAGEQETLRALSNRLVMEVRNPASGLGLTGATSNRDLEFLTAAVPGLAKTPIGNALLVEYLMKQNQFKQDVANEQQRIIDENNGAVPPNLDSRLMRFVDSYQFMDDEFRKDVETAIQAAETPTSSRFTVEVVN